MDRNASYGSSRNIFDHHSRRSEFDNYGDATPQCYKDQADTERIDSGYDSIHWERCSSLSSHLSSLHLSTGSTSKTSDSGTFGMNGPKDAFIEDEREDSGLGYSLPAPEAEESQNDAVCQELLKWFLPDSDGDTYLQLAIIKRKTDLAFRLIQVCPTPELYDLLNDNNQTALHLAVIANQPELVRCLVAYGANINCRDRDGNTPLHLACARGLPVHVDMLTSALTPQEDTGRKRSKLPPNVNERNFEGFTPLHLAAINNHTNVMKILIHDLKCSVSEADLKSGRTALHHALERRHLEACDLLLKSHADVNALTYDECSPLHFAAAEGLKEEAKALLKGGADLFLITLDDQSVFELASHNRLLVDILRDEQAARVTPVTTVAC